MSSVSSLAKPLSAAEFPDLTQPELRSLVGIAKRLLGCDHLAHDAVQEALLALSQQPESPVKPIAWLTRAVIHRSRHLRRCVRRRKHHEHHVSHVTASTRHEAKEIIVNVLHPSKNLYSFVSV